MYLVDQFFNVPTIRTLGQSKVSGVNQGNEVSQRFSCVIPGVWELPISLFVSEMACLVLVECLNLIKQMVVGFCWRCN